MKKRYSVLGSGVLSLSLLFWVLFSSLPAALVMILTLVLKAPLNINTTLLITGFSELLLAVPLIVYMAITNTSLRALLGSRTNWKQMLLAALMGLLLAPAVQGLDTLMGELFTALGAKLPDSSSITPVSWVSMLLGVVMVGVFAGAVEEPIFRGVVLRGLGSSLNRRAAILLTALAFSLIHLEIVGSPTRFLIGVVLGAMAWRSGSVLPGVVTHAAYNSSVLAIAWLSNTALSGWGGFSIPGASPAVIDIVTWVTLSLPFVALCWGVWILFRRVTPERAAWNDRPYAARAVKPSHILPWVGFALTGLALTGFTAISMWLPGINDLINRIGR